MFELGTQVLAAQPFSQLVGARLTEFGDGVATLELDIEDRHRQQYGLVHGGVLSYLVDNVLAFTAGTVLGASVVSTGFSVELVGNAREGTLRATGRVVHATGERVVCSIEVVAVGPDGTEKICALAQGTAVATRPPP